mmetsp:Transcript_27129/g.38851  ORF Transcript_27129/g.38851 Transcript_27129/m.38851 type:complete len:81 (+) Transcript_27129:916-1158(+)
MATIFGLERGFLWRAFSSRWRRLVARGDAMVVLSLFNFVCGLRAVSCSMTSRHARSPKQKSKPRHFHFALHNRSPPRHSS